MFVFGHLGVGLQAARPFKKDLPVRPLLLGTLLPDLIDKPMYYGLSFATGRHGEALGLVCGTRTFAHTILFTASLALLARLRRSKALAAVALGSATHLFLDVVADVFTRRPDFSLTTLAWPLLGWRFPPYAYTGLRDHLGNVREPFLLYAEIVGALLLLVEWRRSRRA